MTITFTFEEPQPPRRTTGKLAVILHSATIRDATEADLAAAGYHRDDPTLDGTDGASQAWWRGCDHGTREAAKRLLRVAQEGQSHVFGCAELQEAAAVIDGMHSHLDELHICDVCAEKTTDPAVACEACDRAQAENTAKLRDALATAERERDALRVEVERFRARDSAFEFAAQSRIDAAESKADALRGELDAARRAIRVAAGDAAEAQEALIAARSELAEVKAERDGLLLSVDRLTTVVDEAFGMQPTMTTDELLTVLEREVHRQRMDFVQARAELERQGAVVEAARDAAERDNDALRSQLAEALADKLACQRSLGEWAKRDIESEQTTEALRSELDTARAKITRQRRELRRLNLNLEHYRRGYRTATTIGYPVAGSGNWAPVVPETSPTDEATDEHERLRQSIISAAIDVTAPFHGKSSYRTCDAPAYAFGELIRAVASYASTPPPEPAHREQQAEAGPSSPLPWKPVRGDLDAFDIFEASGECVAVGLTQMDAEFACDMVNRTNPPTTRDSALDLAKLRADATKAREQLANLPEHEREAIRAVHDAASSPEARQRLHAASERVAAWPADKRASHEMAAQCEAYARQQAEQGGEERCQWHEEDDDGFAVAESTCGKLATTVSCRPFVKTFTCDEHKCRCARPVAPPPEASRTKQGEQGGEGRWSIEPTGPASVPWDVRCPKGVLYARFAKEHDARAYAVKRTAQSATPERVKGD